MNMKIIGIVFSVLLMSCLSMAFSLDPDEVAAERQDDGKSLVLYFSATGNTEHVAQYIADITDSDIKEIVPKEEYTSDDLDYKNDNSRANREQNDNNSRPTMEEVGDIDKYDTIYLGYPIWWGNVPKIILTLLDSHDLSGKTVIPFCTSGQSDITESMNTLKDYNSKINWIDGKRFDSSVSKEDVESWINGLKISK